MDVARGLALIGIFIVNVEYMAQPFGVTSDMTPAGLGPLDQAVWYITHIFAMGRSFPLFAMLFGAGVALMFHKALSAGASGWPSHLRRMFVLAAFGLTHVVLLWYGDILFYYSLLGIPLGLFMKCRPRTLVIWIVCTFLVAAFLSIALSALAILGGPSYPPAPPLGDRPLAQLFETGSFDPTSPTWIAIETHIMSNGPFLDAALMRLILWITGLIFTTLGGFTLLIFTSMLTGVLWLRSGALSDATNPWPRRAALSLLVTLPLSALLTLAPSFITAGWLHVVLYSLNAVIGPIIAAGYLGLVVCIVRGQRFSGATHVLQSAGRIPLTNYLTQSLVGALIFQHWGLAQFGKWSPAECFALVVGVLACQFVFATLWMKSFQIGPVEWLWRTATYLRPPQARRAR